MALLPAEITREELAVIAHMRGWCHDGNACALCDAQTRAFRAERDLDRIICG